MSFKHQQLLFCLYTKVERTQKLEYMLEHPQCCLISFQFLIQHQIFYFNCWDVRTIAKRYNFFSKASKYFIIDMLTKNIIFIRSKRKREREKDITNVA